MPNIAERAAYIRSKLVPVGDCLVYPNYSTGRSHLRINGKMLLVYRIIWEEANGDPKGKTILHSCDNGLCCNLKHLTAGTQRQNILEAVERGLIASKSPLPGVSWQAGRKRWLVMPRINGRKQCLYVGKDFFEAVCKLKSWQNEM